MFRNFYRVPFICTDEPPQTEPMLKSEAKILQNFVSLALSLALSTFLCKSYQSMMFCGFNIDFGPIFSSDYLSLLLKFGLTTVKDRNEIEKNCGFISSCGFILHECMWYFW